MRAPLLLVLVGLAALVACGLLWLGRGEPGPLPAPGPMEPSADPGQAVDAQLTLPTSDLQATDIGGQRENIPAELSVAEQIPPRDAVGDLALTLRVRDDRGVPVELILLHAYHTPPPLEDGTQLSTVHMARSVGEASGIFEVTGFCEGEWRLILSAPAFGWLRGRGRKMVEVLLPHGPGILDVALPRPGLVRGQVLDADGLPLEGIRVLANLNESERSDEYGEFEFSSLASGPVTLKASRGPARAETELNLLPGAELRDVIIRFPAAGRINGWVFTAQNEAAAGIDVVLLSGKDKLASTRTDEFGEFIFEPVLPGDYLVAAIYMDLSEDSGPDFWERLHTQKVTVQAGETAEVTMQIVQPTSPVRIFGTVTMAGEPVAHGHLYAISEGGPALEKARYAVLGEDGSYSMELVSPGPVIFYQRTSSPPVSVADVPAVAEYRHDITLPTGSIIAMVKGGEPPVVVRLHAVESLPVDWGRNSSSIRTTDSKATFTQVMPGRFALTARDDTGRVASPHEVVLSAGQEQTVTLAFTATARVSGTLVDQEGQPVPEATVAALAEHAVPAGSTRTDAQGRFTLGNLAPGNITILASKGQQCCTHSCRLAEGAGTNLELVLVEGGSVLVRVVDSAGRAQGASVRLLDAAQREYVPLSTSDSYSSTVEHLEEVQISRSSFDALPPGPYTIRARTLAGGVSEGSVLIEAGERKIKTIVTD
ncbi:MAG TPA: carboxypeptidase regulatory-like domain-containing protein [Planctomycetes bacterium]|nr:carboxypeptidase regulatory-like domain-containing protein [Planctomycetota bacterium]